MALEHYDLGFIQSEYGVEVAMMPARQAKLLRKRRAKEHAHRCNALAKHLTANSFFNPVGISPELISRLVSCNGDRYLLTLSQTQDVTKRNTYTYVATFLLQQLLGDQANELAHIFFGFAAESPHCFVIVNMVLQRLFLIHHQRGHRLTPLVLNAIFFGAVDQFERRISTWESRPLSRNDFLQFKDELSAYVTAQHDEIVVQHDDGNEADNAVFLSIVRGVDQYAGSALMRTPFSLCYRIILSKFTDDKALNTQLIRRLFDTSSEIAFVDRWAALSQFVVPDANDLYTYVAKRWVGVLQRQTGNSYAVMQEILSHQATQLVVSEWRSLMAILFASMHNQHVDLDPLDFQGLALRLIRAIEDQPIEVSSIRFLRQFFEQLSVELSAEDWLKSILLLGNLSEENLTLIDEIIKASIHSLPQLQAIIGLMSINDHDEKTQLARALIALQGAPHTGSCYMDQFVRMLADKAAYYDYLLILELIEEDDAFSPRAIRYIDPMNCQLLMPLVEYDLDDNASQLLVSERQLRQLHLAGMAITARVAFVVSLFHPDSFTTDDDPRLLHNSPEEREEIARQLIDLLLTSTHAHWLSPWYMTHVWCVIPLEFCNSGFIEELQALSDDAASRRTLTSMMNMMKRMSGYTPAKQAVVAFNQSEHDYEVEMSREQHTPMTQFWSLWSASSPAAAAELRLLNMQP